MIVDSSLHIFKMDIDQSLAPSLDKLHKRNLAQTVKMSDIESQSQIGMLNPLQESVEIMHRLDVHAWFWLEADHDVPLPCQLQEMG